MASKLAFPAGRAYGRDPHHPAGAPVAHWVAGLPCTPTSDCFENQRDVVGHTWTLPTDAVGATNKILVGTVNNSTTITYAAIITNEIFKTGRTWCANEAGNRGLGLTNNNACCYSNLSNLLQCGPSDLYTAGPVFYAYSFSDNGPWYAIRRDLRTGRTYTASGTLGVGAVATDNTFGVTFIGQLWNGNEHARFDIAAFTKTLKQMNPSELAYWANDPWGYWYPRHRVIHVGVTAAPGDAVGAASGVGAASAVGASLAAAVGAASASGAAAATGKSLFNAVASATGTGAASAVGNANFAGVGNAAGVGGGTGISVSGTIAAASGVGSAQAVGASLAAAVGSASASGAAAGIGKADAASVGSATGTGAAAATGKSLFAGVGNAAGSGGGVGIPVLQTVGSASGVGTATAVGESIAKGVGAASASGAAAATGIGAGVGVGTATGSGAASAASKVTFSGVGNAPGVGTAVGVGHQIGTSSRRKTTVPGVSVSGTGVFRNIDTGAGVRPKNYGNDENR